MRNSNSVSAFKIWNHLTVCSRLFSVELFRSQLPFQWPRASQLTSHVFCFQIKDVPPNGLSARIGSKSPDHKQTVLKRKQKVQRKHKLIQPKRPDARKPITPALQSPRTSVTSLTTCQERIWGSQSNTKIQSPPIIQFFFCFAHSLSGSKNQPWLIQLQMPKFVFFWFKNSCPTYYPICHFYSHIFYLRQHTNGAASQSVAASKNKKRDCQTQTHIYGIKQNLNRQSFRVCYQIRQFSSWLLL